MQESIPPAGGPSTRSDCNHEWKLSGHDSFDRRVLFYDYEGIKVVFNVLFQQENTPFQKKIIKLPW